VSEVDIANVRMLFEQFRDEIDDRFEDLLGRFEAHIHETEAHDIPGNLEEPTTAVIRDTFGNPILNLNPGSPSAVQNLTIANAGAGGALSISATAQGGGDSNIDINLEPLGTGRVTESGTDLALGNATAAPSTAALAGATKTWADAITTILQASRVLS